MTAMTNFLRKTCNRAVLFLLSAIIALPLQSLIYLKVLADQPSTWVDGAMPQLTLGDKLSQFPSNCYNTTWYYQSFTNTSGNYDPVGRRLPVNLCAAQAGFGEYGTSGSLYVRPNTAIAFPVATVGIEPNPATKGFIYTPVTPTGFFTYVALFDSLAGAGSFTKLSNNTLGYALNTVPESAYLHDSGGNRVIIRGGRGYSSNGKWLVTYSSNLPGFIRINTETGEYVRFDTTSVDFGLGITPSMAFAVSDDGNTVVMSGMGNWAEPTRVYDLTGCTAPTYPIGGSAYPYQGCRNRYLQSSFTSVHPGYTGLSNMRFTSDGQGIRAIADIVNSNGTHEYYSATLAIAGYQMPHVSYLALGDSFSSGEGAYDYVPPTDMSKAESEQFPKGNKCHLSARSYPYAVSQRLGIDSFRSVACSGATSEDYFVDKQYDNFPDNFVWIPGDDPQHRFVQEYSPDVITISMIGNDIGFADIVETCVLWPESCYASKEKREELATRIYSKFSTLERLYRQIRSDSGGARIYVLGYPQIVSHGYCSTNVHLNSDEIEMARNLTSFLNAVIKAATQRIGVQYIDVENALADHELCADGAKAVNGLTAGDDQGLLGVDLIGHESYHPNQLGHLLLTQALLDQSNNLTKEMPSADASALAPGYQSSEYMNFIGDAPSSEPVQSQHPITDVKEMQLRGETIAPRTDILLKPNSTVRGEYQSVPTPAGTMTTDASGQLTGEISVPTTLAPGFHTLHLYAQDISGEDVDLYKIVYVAASEDDIDGDGIPNDQERCLAVEPVNVDDDRDGIDDACDAEISEPPADNVPPVVTGTPDREPNANGWYNDNATINWTATDPDPSSGAPAQPAATTADQEGVHTYTSDSSCDPLNNCATGSLELKIDKTAPTITYSLSAEPSAKGWNNSPVTVTFSCMDAMSGVVGCSGPQLVSGADGVYVVTGETTDLAGNTNSVNVLISLDSTAPTVTQSVSPAANAYGWHNTDVTVASLCDDNPSGVLDCSPSITLSAEGANQVVESTARDNADNVATASTNINIDKTAPELGADEWSNNPKSTLGTATITIPATDNLSGVAEAEYYLGDTDPGKGNGATMQVRDGTISVNFNTDFPTGVYKVTIRAKDKAGNWSQPLTDYLVVYDPFGTRMTGKRTLIPSLANGDILPGLISATQEDKAKFGFNVRYDKDGKIHKNSDFQFKYETGTKCNKPAQAQNCHSFELDSMSIAWLTTQGQNNSTGIFQGTATLEVDGASSNVIFRLTGLDGEQLNATSEDRLTLKVYPENANPNTDDPTYQVDAQVLRGNVKIRNGDRL